MFKLLLKQESCAVAKMVARCALYMGALNFRDSLNTPTATIPNIYHGLLFRSTLRMLLRNLKSVALPVHEIIGGTQKISAVPGYAHAPFSQKFLMGFYSDWPCECTRQIWNRSFTRSWDNRGIQKTWAVPGYAHAPFPPKFLMGFYLDCPCKCTRQIWIP